MSSIVDIINHYQKSIDRSLNDEARLVHCIGKLYRLPVSVQHLQDTGIGRTVNGLRKYDGEVGVAAKALVNKWKNMVAAEESDTGEPEPQHQNQEEEDEDNYEESCLQVDEDRHSDDQQDEETHADENEDEGDQHQQEEESDNQEDVQTPQQVSNDNDSDHISSHHDSEHHRSSKHKTDRHSHHSSSSSKDDGRSRDRHEKHRDEKKKHHSSSSSSKGHSSSPSSSSSNKKSHRSENEEKDKKDKHSIRKESSHANGKESSHSSTKDKTSSSDTHHSKSKDSLNGSTKEDKSHKRKRTSEDEEDSAVKKTKSEKSSESKSKSCSKSSSSKDMSSSKSSSSSGSKKEKDKKHSSDKKKDASSKRKSVQSSEDVDNEDEDNCGGASFADALAMIGMPSSSKKKSSSKVTVDKVRTSSNSMPPPPAKSDTSRSASNSGYSSSTPTLLAQKPKMAPLPIAEIVESLPMISPNYKPMPLNQTVMECVFSNNGKPQKRPMTEEEALGHSMQSKNIRTKVYSGVKSYNGEVPTLYNLCIRLLQEHIDLIDYTGGIPFDLLKPVLERASPEQLCTLENYNPYLMEDSDVLWEQHCKRNFRSQKRKEEECESWREMFIRCSEERESKLLSLTANIKQSQVAKTAPIRKTQLAYVDSAVKPPRNVISKQARFGTAQAPVVSPAARVAALKSATSNVAKAGDTRLKVAAGARDTAQAQVFHPTKPKKAPLMSKVMQSIKGFKGFRR